MCQEVTEEKQAAMLECSEAILVDVKKAGDELFGYVNSELTKIDEKKGFAHACAARSHFICQILHAEIEEHEGHMCKIEILAMALAEEERLQVCKAITEEIKKKFEIE